MHAPAKPVALAYWGVVVLVGLMSIPVVANMLSARQMMNNVGLSGPPVVCESGRQAARG
jgi:hypothetical protein